MDNKTYTSYHLTVDIPDVACEKCTLQLLNVMTDKTHWCNLTVSQGWAYRRPRGVVGRGLSVRYNTTGTLV